MTKALWLLGAVAIFAVPAPAQVTKTKSGYLLRARYIKGMVIRLRAQMSITGLSGSGSVKPSPTDITMTVLSVEKGLASVRLSLGAIKLGDTLIHAPQTAIVSLNDRNEGATSDAAPGNVASPLPQKPVKIGDTWSSTIPVSTGIGTNGKVNATYKFAGIRTAGGPPVAVLTFTVANMASGKGTMLLLIKDGTFYGSDITLQMNAGSSAIKLSTVITRI